MTQLTGKPVQMTSMRYCSQNHANPPAHRFCVACGERLSQSVAQDQLLAERYRVLQELGQGGFGRTYLAEDLNRFGERCVLKEFAPQVQGDAALQKAQELFEREAGVLYQLKHPQIPRFRELFRAALKDDPTADQERLFLVQDYVEGSTYRQLLEARILAPEAQPPYFSEAEIRLLFEQILPVLRYIHGAGVIHRDLSPDNLILRSSDQLPVLIDFGGVKQIAAAATQKYTHSAETLMHTKLGKQGYAPLEQMQQGHVSPQSDLYALAAMALALMTGNRPLELIAPTGQSQPWQQQISLSPDLTTIITRMLSPQPASRFASAEDVLLALVPQETHRIAVHPPHTPLLNSTAAYPDTQALNADPPPIAAPKRRFVWPLLLLPLLLLPAAAYLWRASWLPLLPTILTADDAAGSNAGSPSPPVTDASPISTPLSPLERRAQEANLDYGFLIQLTDASFAQRHPKQAGRALSDSPEDAKWRQKWADLADQWLAVLPQTLSQESRQKLGRYSEADRNQWKQAINQLYVGSRSLYDLGDAQFLRDFPDWRDSLRDKDFLTQPIGQVWQAIATDQIQALQTGEALEKIEFAAGAFSQQKQGTLAAGEGRVYTANLAAGQILRLNLQSPAKSSLLSIYLPRPTAELPVLLEDSTETTWVGKLPQSGYYEVVIVNQADQPIQYQLTLAVDNVTSPEPDKAEAPEAKD